MKITKNEDFPETKQVLTAIAQSTSVFDLSLPCDGTQTSIKLTRDYKETDAIYL